MSKQMTVAELQGMPPPRNLCEYMQREAEAQAQQMGAAFRNSFQTSANFDNRLGEYMKRQAGGQ